jgi:outer membrane protein OmpU
MKKILLATTVLAATAGFASAEVAVTGKARMGVTNQITTTNPLGDDVEFTQRLRIYFTGSGETDGGLSFGGTVRNDQGGVGNTANNDSTVFISGAFGKITMGDVSGAPDAIVGQVSGVGLTSLTTLNEISNLGNTKTAALYTYSAGALTFGLGFGQPTGADKAVSAAVAYATDMYSVSLGYEDTTAQKRVVIAGSTTFSGVTLKARIANNDELDLSKGNTKNTAYALSADYAMNGVNLTAFFSEGAGYRSSTLTTSGSTEFDGVEAYGLGASYDLGGGASVMGGVAKVNDGSDAIFDLGVSMAF